jgi:hypothetical protein
MSADLRIYERVIRCSALDLEAAKSGPGIRDERINICAIIIGDPGTPSILYKLK